MYKEIYMDSSRYNEFKTLMEGMQDDFEKFYNKGNNAAGTRVRKHLQELAKLCKEVRNHVTEVKNERKESKDK